MTLLFAIVSILTLSAIVISLSIYLYNKYNVSKNNHITTTPSTQNIINLLSESENYIEFTSENNVPKKITLGTFITDIYLVKLFFYFDTVSSVFENALINLIINDENGNMVHKIAFTNFSNSPIEMNLLNLHVMNDYKVVLELNGKIILNSPKLSFQFTTHIDSN